MVHCIRAEALFQSICAVQPTNLLFKAFAPEEGAVCVFWKVRANGDAGKPQNVSTCPSMNLWSRPSWQAPTFSHWQSCRPQCLPAWPRGLALSPWWEMQTWIRLHLQMQPQYRSVHRSEARSSTLHVLMTYRQKCGLSRDKSRELIEAQGTTAWSEWRSEYPASTSKQGHLLEGSSSNAFPRDIHDGGPAERLELSQVKRAQIKDCYP